MTEQELQAEVERLKAVNSVMLEALREAVERLRLDVARYAIQGAAGACERCQEAIRRAEEI